jgi:hypothetical protein
MTWIGGDAAMPQELRFGYGLTIELVISRPYGLRAFQCQTFVFDLLARNPIVGRSEAFEKRLAEIAKQRDLGLQRIVKCPGFQ